MKKKLNLFKNILVCFGALVLCGCSALQYSGDDFDKIKQSSVTTNESFYFKTYEKQVNTAVTMKVGVAKSQISDVLAVYIGVQNNGDYPYNFNTEDVYVRLGGKTAKIVKSSDYVTWYQEQEQALIAASSGLAPTLNSVANFANHYQSDTRQIAMAENNDMELSLKQISAVAEGIETHALRSIAQIPSGEKKYFYLFIEDTELYPVEITYQNLKYTFDVK